MTEKKAAVTDSAGKKSGDEPGVGENEVQAQLNEENEKGYRGERTDPTPLENYTVEGVTSGKPTPETDENAARRASQHEAGQ